MKKLTLLTLVLLAGQSYSAYATTEHPFEGALTIRLAEVEPSDESSQEYDDLNTAYLQPDSDDSSELSDSDDEEFKIWQGLNDGVGSTSDHLNDSFETARFPDDTPEKRGVLEDHSFITSGDETTLATADPDDDLNALDTTFIQSERDESQEVDESPRPKVKSKGGPISWLKKKFNSLNDMHDGDNEFVDYNAVYSRLS